jgi:GTP-binding protein
MRVRDARLLLSAGARSEFPRGGLPEIAFAGRSNVGKSSLLNALVGRRGLARASRTPGRTQRIHFFELDGKLLFADLPGYGYARAPEVVRASWGPMVRSYLEDREPLRLVWVLLDARHPPTAADAQLVEWLRWRRMPFRVVLTKWDRLSGNQRPGARRTCADRLGLGAGEEPLAASARTRAGIAEMWREMDARLASGTAEPGREDPGPARARASAARGRREPSADAAPPGGHTREIAAP